MLERRMVIASGGTASASAVRATGTCNKCGESKEIVLAGCVCGSCIEGLDTLWATATARDWVLITTPGPSDKVHSILQALRESLAAGGRLRAADQNQVGPERYIFRNITYAEMKLHWAMADPPDSCRLGPATPDEVDQVKSDWGTRERLAVALVRPATVGEIAEHESKLRHRRCFEETAAILEKWGFNDEYMPVEGSWTPLAEQRAKQAYEEIRTRLKQLGLIEGSGYEKPHDQMLADYYAAEDT